MQTLLVFLGVVSVIVIGFEIYTRKYEYPRGARLLEKGTCPHCGKRITRLESEVFCPECNENLTRWMNYSKIWR